MWGAATAGMRAKVNSKNESVFFPGGLILVLALIGLAAGAYTRRLRLGLAAGVVVVSILALGFGLTGAGYPYRLLYDYAPGWDGVRVPGRIFTLATLFYALLAGAGAQVLVGRLRAWDARHRLSTALPAAGLPALAGAALADRDPRRRRRAPRPPGRAAAGARLRSACPGRCWTCPPTGPLDRVWQYFSTDGFYKIPIGNSTFDMPAVDDLRGGMNGFPDRASVEKLRYYGIRTVVLHTVLPKGLPGRTRLRVVARAARPGGGRRQADRRPRHHPPAGRLDRDL